MVLILDQATKHPTSTRILALIFFLVFFLFIARNPEEHASPSQMHQQPTELTETLSNLFSIFPLDPRIPGLPKPGVELTLEILWGLASGTVLWSPQHIPCSWNRDVGSWVMAKLGCSSHLHKTSVLRASGFMGFLRRNESLKFLCTLHPVLLQYVGLGRLLCASKSWGDKVGKEKRPLLGKSARVGRYKNDEQS